METAIERLTAISFLAVGLSHILRPKAWSRFFEQLVEKGEPGALINGMMSLNVGAIIVSFHGTEWTGWGAVVTFVGWAQVVKGIVHMCFPVYSLRSMAMVHGDKSWKLVPGGAIALLVAAAAWAASIR